MNLVNVILTRSGYKTSSFNQALWTDTPGLIITFSRLTVPHHFSQSHSIYSLYIKWAVDPSTIVWRQTRGSSYLPATGMAQDDSQSNGSNVGEVEKYSIT